MLLAPFAGTHAVLGLELTVEIRQRSVSGTERDTDDFIMRMPQATGRDIFH